LNADNIDVTDYIPNGFTFNSLVNPTWVDNLDGTLTNTLSVATGELSTGGLAPNASISIDVILDVSHNVPQGMTLTNWAEISSATDEGGNVVPDVDSSPNNVQSDDLYVNDDDLNSMGGDEDDHDPASVNVNEFDLALTKTLATGQSPVIAPGDLVTYTISVINQGDISANNIELVDYIPACMQLADANWSGTTIASRTLSDANSELVTGGLPAGATVSVDITLMVLTTADLSCDFTNWAEIAYASDSDGDVIPDVDSTPNMDNTDDGFGGTDVVNNTGGDEDDHDDAVVGFTPICDLALIKEYSTFVSNGDGTGGQVTFTLTINNQGGCDAYNVQIVDYIQNGWTLNDGNWFLNTFNGFAYHRIL